MNVHIMTPYALDKNLGRAYNEAMARVPPGDWACLLDHDVLLLTPDAGAILHEYARLADPDMPLTCYTNRVSPLSVEQLLGGTVSPTVNLGTHIRLAEAQRDQAYKVTRLTAHFSGFLILLSRRLWDEVRFTEDRRCLGVDTDFRQRLARAGRHVWRMDGLYVWHSYRLLTGIKDKKHLL